jgi:putative Mg2+ transporter-C (MgtC) family protein
MVSYTDVALRLLAAMACGVILGLNRNVRGKSAGMRTFSLVSIGTALMTLIVALAMGNDVSALSRVAQGIVTGIGFLGAGMILHGGAHRGVHGLTTAAAIWFAAALGIACGAGQYVLAAIALALVMFVLIAGRTIERGFERLFRKSKAPDDRAPAGPNPRDPTQ